MHHLANDHTIIKHFSESGKVAPLLAHARNKQPGWLHIDGLSGSSAAVLAATTITQVNRSFLFILSDKESAAYFFNDLENLLSERDKSYENRHIFLFPSAWRKPYTYTETENANVLLRAEVVNRLATEQRRTIVVTYPVAVSEKVVSHRYVQKNMINIRQGETVNIDFLLDIFLEYGFEQADFVVEPGKFCIRGGIVDIFSFSNDFPFRMEVSGDRVESLRSFDPETQLSVKMQETISILPDIEAMGMKHEKREFLLDSMPADTLVWIEDTGIAEDMIGKAFHAAEESFAALHKDIRHTEPEEMFLTPGHFLQALKTKTVVEAGRKSPAEPFSTQESTAPALDGFPRASFHFKPQPSFNKNFELLIKDLEQNTRKGIRNLILSDNPRQLVRIESIFETIQKGEEEDDRRFQHETLPFSIHEGFIDPDSKIACYTDHQIFDRYHRFRIRDKFPGKQSLTLKDLNSLKPGDFVTHIDHGIGVFSGLEKIEVNGKLQEAIRLVYKDQDILYISIHSLHRIAKYSGKEGAIPSLNRLGSNTWNNLKNKAKSRVKDIAKDLIRLYARRKALQGFSFSPDTYLQNELEASFIFEDTPDQEKATADVKRDMEMSHPMDRLICGDVGFGKTEVAIRAAFKAVADSKQVAVLVPTTILALQHYYTFSERLRDFPCNIDYVSRFRSAKERKEVLSKLQTGQLDIVIGTHRLISKDVVFKDLGLLIIDEEQKFGVATKERLKHLKVNVDCLTLTATPIPRTLQFSLMGARDLSMINTPPPNRYPIVTEVHVFNEALLRDAIMYEVSRGGQVFFVHNRVQNIPEVAGVISRLCPDIRIAVGHGQLEGSKLEQIMVDFIHGEYDVLVSTTIIESGLDIPNANTIIINNAHYFGLSDLHQMRGRVGRTNKKAFCYLITPPLSTLTDEARKRLRAIEEFSDLGSGFNIAMRDLDIRGAGNLLGAEQSGFITEIGYEMYQKILNEAMQELKEKEFKDLFTEDLMKRTQVDDCQLETDLELMIPSEYVTNVQERLNLYKELDSIDTEEQLQRFASQLADRFGPLPAQAEGLLDAVRLRRDARATGFEKVILKSGKLIGYFPRQDTSDYYDSQAFGAVLGFAQKNHRICLLKETQDRITLTIEDVSSIDQALSLVGNINN
jgi:transcription-repair coupling factor (superfamily II helicase)